MSVAATPQMWLTLGLLLAALVLFVGEWVPVEIVSLGLLAVMAVLFHLMPVPGPDGANLLSPETLLAGFGNPALLTVMALLVVGEAMSRTGALDRVADAVSRLQLPFWATLAAALALVGGISAFLNDTPVVVMFLPVFQALALRAGQAPSRVMMPLSFAAILGGSTTLIGSSTNLLVNSALIGMGLPGLGFFDQTAIALLIAVPGVLYVALVLPHTLPRRGAHPAHLLAQGKQFVSQCWVAAGSALDGAVAVAGSFPALPEVTVHLIVRGGQPLFPPYDEAVLAAGDLLVLAGTRRALADAAARYPGLLTQPETADVDGAPPARPRERGNGAADKVLVEAMVPPTSRYAGLSVDQLRLPHHHNLVVVGIERRARMLRRPMTELPLQAGDVLLLFGAWVDLDEVARERDLVVISGSAVSLRQPHHAKTAGLVFAAMVALSAFGLLPIAAAAVAAAAILVAAGALTPRQAVRAIDIKVVLLVGAALALGESLDATGAAAWLAEALLGAFGGAGGWLTLTLFFGLVAIATNVLSNNACAVLFTPIGVGVAQRLGIDPALFAITVILASNCSFLTPVSYQTNLLVMGAGHYRFVDYFRAGLPLFLLCWGLFALGVRIVWGI
ncbi:SLC13 family permease [Magnetospirillum sp. UT-4]|uniref:SLC13 family permease n=1 Tax=Magnetospirillum sp. UT-4 TaxID=2681467 RepID=UPI0020C491E1|nr:SLC13 family permease [Magnetospirillum sp. UT-4]